MSKENYSANQNNLSHNCFICGGLMDDWFIKKGRLLLRCRNCRLIQVPDGILVTKNGVSIYEDDDNVFLKYGSKDYYFDETNLLSCQNKLKWIQKFIPEKIRLLDAGANLGHFLKVSQDYFDVTGFELSPLAVAWGREHFRVSNHVASIYNLPENLKGPFNVVTCWDVIKHLPDPVMALRQLWEIIEPGGYLFLSTPNADSCVARIMGQYWHYLDPLQHITLFTLENLKKTLTLSGFKAIDTCSFGHYYRLSYIFDRLLYIHQDSFLKWGISAGRRLFGFAMNRVIYLRLFDVMGIAAIRQK